MMSTFYSDSRGSLSKFDLTRFDKSFTVKESIISTTYKALTARGLHLSLPPMQESKIIRCISGKMLWIYIDQDISSTWNIHSRILDPSSCQDFIINPGRIHGCISLMDNTQLHILSSNIHSESHSVYYSWSSIIDNICSYYGIDRSCINYLDSHQTSPASISSFNFYHDS